MNKLLTSTVFCILFACAAVASSVPKSTFYLRAMAAIPTPDANHAATATTANAAFSLAKNIETDPRFRRGSWHSSGREHNPARAGLGLTIAGSVVAALGAAIIIANANAVERPSPTGGTSGGHHYEYDIIGGVLIAGGLGMLIPGIILLCKGN